MNALRTIAIIVGFVVVLIIVGTLESCGGGGGNVSAPTQPPLLIPPAPRADLVFGYFGTVGNQVAETASHVNLTFHGAWGDSLSSSGRQAINARIIAEMQTAQAAGIRRAIVDVGHLAYPSLLSGELRDFLLQLRAAGVVSMVSAFYPIDEPDVAHVSEISVSTTNAAIRAIAVQLPELANVKLAVIYGVNGTPGIASYDWIGFDEYGAGAGVLRRYNGLGAGQGWLLVPGGSNPWRNDPGPFLDRAEADPNVVGIIAFVWFDDGGWEGGHQPGVRSNGMAHAYCVVGQTIKAQIVSGC